MLRISVLSITLAAFSCALVKVSLGASISVIGSTILGQDPQTVNHLNGESFQQDALVTFNGTPKRVSLHL
jgi:hypothetical protein